MKFTVAFESVSVEARSAGTGEASVGVGAVCVVTAPSVVKLAFVNICTRIQSVNVAALLCELQNVLITQKFN